MTLQNELKTLLEEVPNTLHVINPSKRILNILVEELYSHKNSLHVNVFATKTFFNNCFENIKLAAKSKELTENDVLSLRNSAIHAPPVLLYDNTIVVVISEYVLTNHAPEVASELIEFLSQNWDATEQYHISTPSLSAFYDKINSTFGSSMLLDVKEFFDASSTTTHNLATLIILAAAKNTLLFRDVTNWNQKYAFVSHNALIDTRSTLEQNNVITTQQTETNSRGRPPLQLQLKQQFQNQSPKQLLNQI